MRLKLASAINQHQKQQYSGTMFFKVLGNDEVLYSFILRYMSHRKSVHFVVIRKHHVYEMIKRKEMFTFQRETFAAISQWAQWSG